MAKKKSELNSKEREIIRVIHKHGGYMTAHEISVETGISYVTVQKYLNELYKKKVLVKNDRKEEKK